MEKQLRVWWIPQVPGKPFHVNVPEVNTAKLVMDTLADYDKFQFENRIKPDYSNAGGVQVYEDPDGEGSFEWVDWYDEETGMDFDEYMESLIPSQS